jgi:hypothetical protein
LHAALIDVAIRECMDDAPSSVIVNHGDAHITVFAITAYAENRWAAGRAVIAEQLRVPERGASVAR